MLKNKFYSEKMRRSKQWLTKVTKTSNNLYHTTPSWNIESIKEKWLTLWNKKRFTLVSLQYTKNY
jgi:hypothetical protein